MLSGGHSKLRADPVQPLDGSEDCSQRSARKLLEAQAFVWYASRPEPCLAYRQRGVSICGMTE